MLSGSDVRRSLDKPWASLTEEEKMDLDYVYVTAWDVITANSGGHKCITNIAGLNFFKRGKRKPRGRYKKPENTSAYVDLLKKLQSDFVPTLKEKIRS